MTRYLHTRLCWRRWGVVGAIQRLLPGVVVEWRFGACSAVTVTHCGRHDVACQAAAPPTGVSDGAPVCIAARPQQQIDAGQQGFVPERVSLALLLSSHSRYQTVYGGPSDAAAVAGCS